MSKIGSASSNGALRQPTRWTRKRLLLAIGLIFVVGIVAAALDLRFVIGGSPRAVEPDSLLVLDPVSGATQRVVAFRGKPAAVSLSGNSLAVTIGSVTRLLDLNDLEGATTARASPVVRTPCNDRIELVNVERTTWYACHDPDSLLRIRDATGRGVRVPGITIAPTAAAYGAGRVWAVVSSQNELIAVNPFTAEIVEKITVGTEPSGVAVAFGAVWVANAGNGTVTRVDLAAGSKVETIGLNDQPSAIAAGAGAVWVVSTGGKTVVRIDPKSKQVTKKINLANPPQDVAAGAGRVWVTIGD